MIRKYFSGLLAAFLAITMVAFTPSEKEPASLTSHTFYFIPPGGNDYSESAVEDESNWKTALSPLPSCPSNSRKACSIVVDESNTTGADESRTLNFQLNAVEGSVPNSNEFVPDMNSTSQIISKVDKL